jgi:dihydrofolate reductase
MCSRPSGALDRVAARLRRVVHEAEDAAARGPGDPDVVELNRPERVGREPLVRERSQIRSATSAHGNAFRRGFKSVRHTGSPVLEESSMTAIYTFDVFSSLDGYGAASANWTGYWGKQGPELLDHRLGSYGAEQRMVFGANTYRAFARMLASSSEESEVRDPWVTRMRSLPATVVSTTLEGPLDWPNATVESGDAVDVVARLKEESEVPLRSHGSLSLNRALMAAGLVDLQQVTLFPVITGQTGVDPIFQGAADFDLELLENRTLDGHIQELIYWPTLHV